MAHLTKDGKAYRFTGTLTEHAERAMDRESLGKLTPEDMETLASDARGPERTEWSMTGSLQEALDLARNGWAEGTKRLSDLRDGLMDRVGQVMPEEVYMRDVSGFEVDVSAYLAGEPEHMITTASVPGRERQIHVMLNVGTSAHRSPESMMMRGLMAAGVVDALESMGHRVTLDVATFLYGNNDATLTHIVNIKRAEDPLDLERTVFACAHPSMLRRLTFGVMESMDKTRRKWFRVSMSSGYGSPSDQPEYFLSPDEMPDLYIGNASRAETLEEVADEVVRYLRESGVVEAD